MSKHLKFKPVIIILILVNVFLITLYHHTQIKKKSGIYTMILLLLIFDCN